jgi:quercetin dioxygenase-like cupin family protein
MQVYNWNTIPTEDITDLISRQYVSADNITLAKFIMKKGSKVQVHSHENEQLSTIMEGVVKFTIDGGELILGKGETLRIPPFSAHGAEAIEDATILDVFSPIRKDWESGDDAYLRGNK